VALKVTNTYPSQTAQLVKVGEPLFIGLRPDTGIVDINSIRKVYGTSGVIHKGVLPESVTNAPYQTTIDTPERAFPKGSSNVVTLPSGNLNLQSATGSISDLSVYEISVPITGVKSPLAYFKFQVTNTWTSINPTWSDLANMVGPYFGLEYGPYNTGCYAFLRRPTIGTGSLVVGGPLTNYSSARPNQTSFAGFDWVAASGNFVEIYIWFNTTATVPLIEVWATTTAGNVPTIYMQSPVGSLGTYPSRTTNSDNFRYGTSDLVRMFMGFNGAAGESVTISDWKLIPDFSTAMLNGQTMSGYLSTLRSDGVITYAASNNSLPTSSKPARFTPITGSGTIPPIAELRTVPGRPSVPDRLQLTRGEITDLSGYTREEPRLGELSAGFLLELDMAVKNTAAGDAGSGFFVDDGVKRFQVSSINTISTQTYGLLKSPTYPLDVGSYYLRDGLDNINTRKTVNLTYDRIRDSIKVALDTDVLVDENSSITLPASTTANTIGFGFLTTSGLGSVCDFSSILFVPGYKAWDALDGDFPQASALSVAEPGNPFVSNQVGTGSVAITDKLSIIKESIALSNSVYSYTKVEALAETHAIFLEFSFKVSSFNDLTGRHFPASGLTECGVCAHFGNKSLVITPVTTGMGGRKLAIVPASGTAGLISNAVESRPYMATCDWTQTTKVRVLYIPFDSIKLWINVFTGEPDITIPWTGEFNLLEQVKTASLEFGHFGENSASRSEWNYFRYGCGVGYDTSIQKVFTDNPAPYEFDGKLLSLVEFDE
jgi:hypothetical protein